MKKFLLILALVFPNLIAVTQAQPLKSAADVSRSEHDMLTATNIQPGRDTTGYDLHYMALHLSINPDTLLISGTVEAEFTARESSLNKVIFDLHDNLEVTQATSEGQSLAYTHQDHLLTITLPNTLNQGAQQEVAINYHGVPSSEGFGSFEQGSHNDTPIIWTLSEPYGARDWFPCKQWLRDKVDSLDVFVKHPSRYKAASNGVLVSEQIQNDTTITHWRHRYPIATYLIAVAITDYVSYSDYLEMPDGDSLQILNYVYPENENNAREKTPNILPVMELYNELFIPYPFSEEKYGHAQFGWGGGMEHQTMSFMGSFGHHLMAHEVAHQWFGNYITCGSWKEIWLNEGFAVYLTGLTYERMFEGNYWRPWRESTIENVTSEPGGSVIVYDTSSVSRVFNGRLTYNKAGYVLHMLRKQIGDSAFFQGIRAYLKDTALINNYAHTADVRRHLEAAADTTLTEYFQDWLYGEGYPIYSLQWSQNEDGIFSVKVGQKTSTPDVDFFEMHITLKAKGLTRDTLLQFHHTQKEQTFAANLDFQVEEIMFNPELSILTKDAEVMYLEKIEQGSNIKLSPNPVKQRLRIQLKNKIQPQILRIFSAKGKLVKVYASPAQSNPFYLNVTDLSNGTYILEIKTNEGNISQVFLKM